MSPLVRVEMHQGETWIMAWLPQEMALAKTVKLHADETPWKVVSGLPFMPLRQRLDA